MATRAIAVEDAKTGEVTEAVYEHPFIVRFCHWLNAVALFVMVGSGLQIFRAFPSFGAKIPQKDLLNWPKAFAIGGWLGGALQWHLTFMWIYIGTGLVYFGYQVFSGNYKQVLFVRGDLSGVWPMVRHYFFFRTQAASKGNLQPAAETSLYDCDRVGGAIGGDGSGGVEAGAVFLVGMDDGWLSLGANLALRDHVGNAGVCVRASGDGDAARVEQLRLHVDGMEEGSGVPGEVGSGGCGELLLR